MPWYSSSTRWSRFGPTTPGAGDGSGRRSSCAPTCFAATPNRAEITWRDRNLYAMLVKRLANTSPALREYCRESRIKFEDDADLGLIPMIKKSTDARPLIERLAGQYMGADLKKGRTFAWLLSHIRDGNGHAMPRALVWLIEQAAIQERDRPQATYNRLLDPRSLRRALDDVSKDHVLQVNTHELPWLPGVKQRLDSAGVPMPRREIGRASCR